MRNFEQLPPHSEGESSGFHTKAYELENTPAPGFDELNALFGKIPLQPTQKKLKGLLTILAKNGISFSLLEKASTDERVIKYYPQFAGDLAKLIEVSKKNSLAATSMFVTKGPFSRLHYSTIIDVVRHYFPNEVINDR